MTYDAAGNRTSMYVSDIANPTYSGTTNYTYDYKDELTQEQTTRNGSSTNNFAYDVAGNFTTNRNATVPAANADNQLTTSGYSYDGDGNPTTYAGSTLKYDPESRMTAYGSAETNGYGMDGLRVWRTQGGVTTFYIYDGNSPTIELSSTGALLALNTFGRCGLISRATNTATTAKHFYAFDPEGSPVVILDGTGTQVAAVEADAFGKSVYTANVSSDPYGGFGSQWGYYTDSGTGMELLAHRYYDSNAGRFINRDPISYLGGINVYSYVLNHPTGSADPSGFDEIKLPFSSLCFDSDKFKDCMSDALPDILQEAFNDAAGALPEIVTGCVAANIGTPAAFAGCILAGELGTIISQAGPTIAIDTFGCVLKSLGDCPPPPPPPTRGGPNPPRKGPPHRNCKGGYPGR